MDEIKVIRAKIDTVDEQIMALLEKRFALASQIGGFKKSENIAITHKTREDAILLKANAFSHCAQIQAVYQEIFQQSKLIQEEV